MSNIFGGGNANSLYTPMSEDEREVLQRLIDADDLEIVIHGWGIVNKFIETPAFGDLRLQMKFWVHFRSPDVEIPVTYFDLELRTRSGIPLYREKQAICDYDGGPLYVKAGVQFPLIWDIAIQRMDPRLVKAIKPGSIGLTTRDGNMRLGEKETAILHDLRRGEEKVRRDNQQRVAAAMAQSKQVYSPED